MRGGTQRVQAAGDWAAELNRRAMNAGITLCGLRERRPSLEEAFFSITDQPAAERS